MTRPWLLLIPIMAGVAPLAAQLTPEQRAQREAAAVRTTIGYTRRLDAARLEEMDPLRGLRCNGIGAVSGCDARFRRTSVTRCRWGCAPVDLTGTGVGQPSGPFGIHFAAFGDDARPAAGLRPLGTMPVTLKADHPTTLTLASQIGGSGRALMIHVAVATPGTEPTWSRMGEAMGDQEGRYLVQVPSFPAGKYELLVEVYDPDRPIEPFSVSRTALTVR